MASRADREAAFKRACGTVLREARLRRGLTQDELSSASAVHVNHISFIERGLRVPSALVVFLLAEALGERPSELVARVEDELRRP